LRWLKDKQITTARTRADGHTRHRPRPTGYYQGITGLALLAFLGFGANDKHPPEFAETVRMAVEYLSSDIAQYKTGAQAGSFLNNTSKEFYAQGICTMALCGASRMLTDNTLRQKARDAAQLGMNYIAANQGEHGVFTYGGNPNRSPAIRQRPLCRHLPHRLAVSGRGCRARCRSQRLADGARPRQCLLRRVLRQLGALHLLVFPPCTNGDWMALQHTPNSLNTRLMLGQGRPIPTSCSLPTT